MTIDVSSVLNASITPDNSPSNDQSNKNEIKRLNKNPAVSSFRYILTNARSLTPKIESLLDFFDELDLQMAIITESWLKPGKDLERSLRDLEDGERLKIIHKSRPSKRNRTAGCGVAIAFNQDKLKLTERPIKAGRAEIICATGKLPKMARKIVVFAVYIPPKTRAPQVNNIMSTLNDEISRAKTDLNDPVIIIGGDYNKKPFHDSVVDFPDVHLLPSGPTRGNETLDLVFTNVTSTTQIKPPLESDDGSLKSDHSTVLVESSIGNEHRFEWKFIKSRPKTDRGITSSTR